MYNMLLNRLKHAEPSQRIDALRILAMVEETRALEAVGAMIKADPVEEVRRAAYWAGRILWAAKQRGHSTEQAMQARFGSPQGDDREDILLREMARSAASGKNAKQAELMAQQQMLRGAMLDAMFEEREEAPDVSLSDLAADLLDDDGQSR